MQKQPTAKRPARNQRDDDRYESFAARDASRAGEFYMAVTSTGIYCRPGCPARLPKRTNVAFFDTAADAAAAGFRPCKRCKPDEGVSGGAHRELIAETCRRIETAEEMPRLRDLALDAGLSPYHFHRLFKSIVGVTPKAYAVAHRRQRVRENLSRSSTVTGAIHASGFNSNGRFYVDSCAALGMTPSRYRARGEAVAVTYAVAPCTMGTVLVAASPAGICAIYLGDDAKQLLADLRQQFSNAELAEGGDDFAALTRAAVALVDAPEKGCSLPLDIRGTAFQHRVWEALRAIPAGETRTYAQVAQAIGSPKAVRAVGSACGANEISVAIPCHRVVRSDGSLPNENYRWGAQRKKALLEREAKARKR